MHDLSHEVIAQCPDAETMYIVCQTSGKGVKKGVYTENVSTVKHTQEVHALCNRVVKDRICLQQGDLSWTEISDTDSSVIVIYKSLALLS